MKKIKMKFLLAILFLFSFCFAAVNPQLQLYNYSLSKFPAAPGDTLTLTLHIRNIEFANCAERVSVQVITAYPLSVQGLDTRYLPDLCLNDPDSKGTVSFDIPVDSLAQSGTFPITVITNYEQRFDKFSATNTINARVSGTPYITASVTSSNPTDIYPGDKATITITFQNSGTGRIESGRVALSAPSGIDVKWAGKEQDIGLIPSRGSASLVFTIEALKDTKPGNYALTADLSYNGENSVIGTQKFSFVLPVKEKAEFIASAKNGTKLNADDDTEVSLVLRNTGTQEARKLKVRIQPIFPFSTDGTVRYIDSLMPGEEKELIYMIHVDKDATAGGQIAGVLIDYEDPQGKKFSNTEDFALSVVTKTLVQQAMDYWYLFAIILLIVVIALLRMVYGLVSKAWKDAGEKK
jgi:hypothetical protein